MKLANIEWQGLRRVAMVIQDEVIDISAALGGALNDASNICTTNLSTDELARRCVRSAGPRLPLESVKLLAPSLNPGKILGVGMNYRSFVAAARRIGLPIPEHRVWFLRPRGCMVGPRDDVWLPQGATDLDYEAELTVVIGRRCRRVREGQASAVIAGYTVGNDMTLRNQVSKSLVLAKSFDTHTPMGPWIVTPDELMDVRSLAVKTWVNGQLRQNGSTADMISTAQELIREISSFCTLDPGDLIMTGTPDGSGIFQQPPVGLSEGDVVRVAIEGIGVIENRVVLEPDVQGIGQTSWSSK